MRLEVEKRRDKNLISCVLISANSRFYIRDLGFLDHRDFLSLVYEKESRKNNGTVVAFLDFDLFRNRK